MTCVGEYVKEHQSLTPDPVWVSFQIELYFSKNILYNLNFFGSFIDHLKKFLGRGNRLQNI